MHQYIFRWTFDDHVRAQRQVIRHMIGGAWFKALPVAATALLLAVIIAIFVLGTESRPQAAFTALPYVLILVLVLFMTRFGTPWLAARRVQRDDPSVKGDIKHVVSERGLAISSVAATIELTWDHIRQVVETTDFFL